jgi:hypothetical protein
VKGIEERIARLRHECAGDLRSLRRSTLDRGSDPIP